MIIFDLPLVHRITTAMKVTPVKGSITKASVIFIIQQRASRHLAALNTPVTILFSAIPGVADSYQILHRRHQRWCGQGNRKKGPVIFPDNKPEQDPED